MKEINFNKIDHSYAYIDGSYNPKYKCYSCAVDLVDQYGKSHRVIKRGQIGEKGLRNVSGELLGAKMAMLIALKLKMKNLIIYYDYLGIEKWATGKWKAKNAETLEYQVFYTGILASGLNVYFKKVKAHSGDAQNDGVDTMAKYATKLYDEIDMAMAVNDYIEHDIESTMWIFGDDVFKEE